MPHKLLPPLALNDWWETRDRIQLYARLLGALCQHLAPRQKHGFHAGLQTTAVGLTTTPLPAGRFTLEMSLDFSTHMASVKTSRGDWHDVVLEGQSPRMFLAEMKASLEELGLAVALDETPFRSDEDIDYDEEAVDRFWQALSQIDSWLKAFKADFRGETGPVQLYPDEFDLSLLWLTGRLLPDQDPDDPEKADEHVLFGFSTGDEGINEPYFYNMVYPWPDTIVGQALPAGASWVEDGFNGSVITYETVRQTADPRATVLAFWHAHRAAARTTMGL